VQPNSEKDRDVVAMKNAKCKVQNSKWKNLF
jgi:hypothetical protein